MIRPMSGWFFAPMLKGLYPASLQITQCELRGIPGCGLVQIQKHQQDTTTVEKRIID